MTMLLRWLINNNRRKFAALIICASVHVSAYASASRGFMDVSCSVVKPAMINVTPINSTISSSESAHDNSMLVNGIKINCPKGTIVTVSYHQSTECNNKQNVNGSVETQDVSFYKDASCTEVWQPGESQSYCFNDDKHTVTAKIFCKLNKKEIDVPKGAKIVIATLQIDY
jgi:hypothetical protein